MNLISKFPKKALLFLIDHLASELSDYEKKESIRNRRLKE